MTLDALAGRVAGALGVCGLDVVGEAGKRVEVVAVACGAGDSLIGAAARAGADAVLTGELRYHAALEAEAWGLAVLAVGHHASERPGVEALAERVREAFPGLEAWSSMRERDPFRRFQSGE
jgi:putative NIF3 family GTP cyclohydrolase 1 type 2